jgi:hypothetical protein
MAAVIALASVEKLNSDFTYYGWTERLIKIAGGDHETH